MVTPIEVLPFPYFLQLPETCSEICIGFLSF